MRAKIESARVLSAKLSGDYTSVAPKDILFAGMVSTGLPSLPGTKAVLVSSGLTFQEAIDRYLAQKTPAWAMKMVQFVTYALKAAAELYGPDKALAKYLATDKRLFRDTLAKLPPHQEKMAKSANLTMLQAAEASENGPFLSTKTQKKNLDFLGAFLIWATNEEYLEKPPGSGIKTAPAKTLGNVAEREPYTASDLKKIFASPIFAGSKSSTRRAEPGNFIAKNGYYWVPLIGLYTGMRLGEIIQLRSGSVEAIDGIALFKVQMDAEGSNQIKTSSSYRSIPIHAKLIELGLLKHIKDSDPAGRLFPEIKPGADGYMSHNYSKWWGRYSTKAGFARDKTAFHSFRHSFKDALDAANVPEQIAMALMGHSNNLVLSRIRAAPSARLGHLSFEGQGAFPSQC